MRNRSGNTGDRLSRRAVAAPVRLRAECVMVQSLGSLRRGAVLVSVLVTAVLLVGIGMGTVAAQDAPTEEFSETYGGEKFDGARSVVETSDGGFALAGSTFSFGSGSSDAWLVKTDANGNVEFYKTFGGAGFDMAYSVIETSDRGFVLAGRTESESFPAGQSDGWLIKTDANGNVEFSQNFGGWKFDKTESVIETADGGFALAGTTESFGAGYEAAWIIKTDENGNKEFSRTYGGENFDNANSVIETSDCSFAIGGHTESFAAGEDDAWIIKTDTNGNEEFNRTFGREGFDMAYSVIEASDGGFVLAARTESDSFASGQSDAWLIKTDASGNEEFNKTFGGSDFEIAPSVVETSDGGFALAAQTSSFGAGVRNTWLVKTDSDGNEQYNETYEVTDYDRAHSIVETSDGGFALAGFMESFGNNESDAWMVKLSGSD